MCGEMWIDLNSGSCCIIGSRSIIKATVSGKQNMKSVVEGEGVKH